MCGEEREGSEVKEVREEGGRRRGRREMTYNLGEEYEMYISSAKRSHLEMLGRREER